MNDNVTFLRPRPAIHPVITAGDMRTMNAHELAFFTDSPVNHVVAFRDFQRAAMIDARNTEAFDRYQRNARLRAHEARG